MRQFILPADWDGSPTCPIVGGPARYLLRVLRLSAGDAFAGLDPEGKRRDCIVLETGSDSLLVSVGPPREAGESLPDTRGSRMRESKKDTRSNDGTGRIGLPRMILIQGITKGPAMDLIVRQAAEAGIARLIPFAARHSVAMAKDGASGGSGVKVERWSKIALAGLQQSGSAIRTIVEAPASLAELGDRLSPPCGKRLCLLLHETPLAQTSLHEYLGDAPEEIVLCVGPEGGFAREEVDHFLAAGFRPLLLPGAILRAETAALFAVASVEIILSEHRSWIPCL